MQKTVLVSDYAWKDLNLEQAILGRVNARLIVSPSGSEAELASLAPEADGILTCWRPVSAQVLQAASRCVAVGRYGIGLDNIDVGEATRLGMVVTNVPSYCVEEVSDHALALLLSLARKVTFYDRAIKSGAYDLQAQTPLFRLRGRTLGIVGFGRIGRALCRKAQGLGLQVIAFDPYLDPPSVAGLDVEVVTFEELLHRSDYISIHAPLTSETRALFDRAALQQMKEESLIELRKTAARQMADVLTSKLPRNIVNGEVLKQSNLRAAFRD